MTLTGDWDRVKKLFGSSAKGQATMKILKERSLGKVLAYFEAQIKLNITSGGTLAGQPFEKLSNLTMKIKKSSKPLLDTGDMRKNVKPIFIDENAGFVGLKRGLTHKKGGKMVDIAEIHEFGAIVKKHTIPARPFIGPVLKKFKKAAGEVYLKESEKVLNG